jgi:antagonist of KipI
LSFPRIVPLGARAFSVELGGTLDPETNARVRALDRELARRPFVGWLESVPTLCSLLVLYDRGAARPAVVERELLARLGAVAAPLPPGRLHEVKAAYGGELGPDLPGLARSLGLRERELVALHTGREYTAFMLGFKPGFAYLGLLAEPLVCPRHRTPRVRVPPGSVALAGRQTAVYPGASPGGWQLIGRSSVPLFDPGRDEPSLIAPGDRVRFVEVSDFQEPAAPVPISPPSQRPVVAVVEGGLLTTVQDAGRVGMRRLGVGGAGAVDRRALCAANLALGNAPGAAALECTVAGPELEFLAPVRFALAGADLGALLERSDLGAWPVPRGTSVLARPGNRLRFVARRSGCRAYLAFAGGLEVPAVLGARSTDLAGGFGGYQGRALRRGDRLGVAAARVCATEQPSKAVSYAPAVSVRVVMGPQRDAFEATSLPRFFEQRWRVGRSSDRIGLRLEGDALRHRGSAEILSDGMVPGSIQVPPDGQPIVMLADAPTTGGYPKLATVLEDDLPLLAQLVPGEGEVRFERVSLREL